MLDQANRVLLDGAWIVQVRDLTLRAFQETMQGFPVSSHIWMRIHASQEWNDRHYECYFPSEDNGSDFLDPAPAPGFRAVP